MEITVITACYNAAKHLAETIDSVRYQTFSDWEYILVDDGSKDNTRQIIESYTARDPRIRLLSQENQGMAAARNSGFSVADPGSKYVIFLDHDDVWEPYTLATLRYQLIADPKIVASYGLARYFGDPPTLFHPPDLQHYGRDRSGLRNGKVEKLPLEAPTTFADLVIRNWITTPGQGLVRREAQKAAGDFDQEVYMCADWDMWIRLSRLGPIDFVNSTVLNYRLHAGNASKKSKDMDRHILITFYKTIKSSENTPEQRRLAIQGLRAALKIKIVAKWKLAGNGLRRLHIPDFIRQCSYTIRPTVEYCKSMLLVG